MALYPPTLIHPDNEETLSWRTSQDLYAVNLGELGESPVITYTTTSTGVGRLNFSGGNKKLIFEVK